MLCFVYKLQTTLVALVFCEQGRRNLYYKTIHHIESYSCTVTQLCGWGAVHKLSFSVIENEEEKSCIKRHRQQSCKQFEMEDCIY